MDAGITIAVISVGVPTAFGVFKLLLDNRKINRKFDNFDTKNVEDHIKLFSKIDKIAGHLSLEDTVVEIANETQRFVKPSDQKMLKFIQVCVDVTVDFFKELTTGGLYHKTEDDVRRAANKALARVHSAASSFDQKYKDAFWPEFQNKAVMITDKFINIVMDTPNWKLGRFRRTIELYVIDQFNHLIETRKRYWIEIELEKK